MKNVSHKKSLIVTTAVVLVLLAAIGVVRQLLFHIGQPVTVSLTAGRETGSQNDYQLDFTPKIETGQHVSFSYPVGLISRPRQASAPYLENFYYSARATEVESWGLAISVSNLPAGDLANSSSFMLRKDNPGQYAESEETINGARVVIMTDHTDAGFSKIAYLQHDSMLATVSLTANHATRVQTLQETFESVLYSWQWLR